MYTSQMIRVKLNGACSDYFSIRNGVKQGRVISPISFCVYADGLLKLLSDAKVGCYTGPVFVGLLAYADDFYCWLRVLWPCANYWLCAMNLQVDLM